MIINNLTEACDFVCDWLGVEQSYPPKPSIPTLGLPTSIEYLANRFGQLWQDNNHPVKAVLNHPDCPLSLFEFQDIIVSPNKYSANSEGVIPFIVENQGVWQFGFNPSKGDKLFVSGDWNIDDGNIDRESWRQLDATVEDALVFVLLGNLCLMCSEEEDWDFDEESGPLDGNERLLLWSHPEWDEFDGFWTNSSQTLIHYSQSWLTVRKRKWPVMRQ
ncbi:hypothetical protein [Aliiroseovarius sp. F20344]|uniref:hypothetical protein n=1 Tax=Aliiroseovarius sp. F20344 TaxID=2926414 RepID=UPI001FF5641C|nr:hypothetical protein [Aliiroseovarius sp. F20344]MCK0142368.1 hypothetical protein [Aliiroseovarius sp. F20344]